jgi:tRNA (guanine-N7-)-methyltransferase
VCCADALRVFAERIPDDALAAVHVYFPDPWWKKRHKKRRVLKASFLKDLERVLRTGGRFEFWTDVQEYFESTLELVRSSTGLAGPRSMEEPSAEHDLDYRTHFERRTRLNALPVYRAQYVKEGA